MATIREYTDRFPPLALDKVLEQLKEKLGEGIEFTVTDKSVFFVKIPANYKDNIFEAITNIGFSPSLL